MANAKKILIESETTEIFRLRVSGHQATRLFCLKCEAVEEMIDLNTAADVSGSAAREILSRLESGELHSPEISSGHLLICRASLENAINSDKRLRPAVMMLKETL